jgi:hypothetical protein
VERSKTPIRKLTQPVPLPFRYRPQWGNRFVKSAHDYSVNRAVRIMMELLDWHLIR